MWGDIEDDDTDLPVQEMVVSSPTRLVPTVHTRYPVRYERHKSTYDKILYDITGQPLLDEEGKYLNVWRADFKDYLSKKIVSGVRVPNGQHAFLYFTTNPDQRQSFKEICEKGSMPNSYPLHVYVDDARTKLPHE